MRPKEGKPLSLAADRLPLPHSLTNGIRSTNFAPAAGIAFPTQTTNYAYTEHTA